MKRTGLNIICSLLLAGGMCACTATPKQTEEIKWSERMAQSEMQRFPEPWMIEKAKKPRWGYTHGLVVKSMLEEWKHTGDTAYYNYAKIYADSLIDTDGKIKTMKYLSLILIISMPERFYSIFMKRRETGVIRWRWILFANNWPNSPVPVKAVSGTNWYIRTRCGWMVYSWLLLIWLNMVTYSRILRSMPIL